MIIACNINCSRKYFIFPILFCFSWILPLNEALTRGAQGGNWNSAVEAFWNYIRSDNYRRLYESHPVGVGSPPPKRNKDKKISRPKLGGGTHEKGGTSRAQSRER